MKTSLLALSSLASLSLIVGCAAPAAEDEAGASSQDIVTATSAYTELGKAYPLDSCKEVKLAAGDFDATRAECDAMGDYALTVDQYEETQGVLVRTPTGTFHIDAFSAIGMDAKDGYVGKLAEWRGRGIAIGQVEPSALILRYFTATESAGYGTFKGRNSLLVVKLSPEGACIHSAVSGAVANHNQLARDITDSQAFADFKCPAATPEPLPSSRCGTLAINEGLELGEAVTSCSGSHSLVMQWDGNLVVYNNANGRATWSSRTVDSSASAAILRPNGQLGVFGSGLVSVFATPVIGEGTNPSLAVQDDGNVVIYVAGRAVWSTGTQGK